MKHIKHTTFKAVACPVGLSDLQTVGYFFKREDAAKAAKTGHHGDVKKEDIDLIIFDSFEEFEKYNAEKKLQAAKDAYHAELAKLTARDCEVLGWKAWPSP